MGWFKRLIGQQPPASVTPPHSIPHAPLGLDSGRRLEIDPQLPARLAHHSVVQIPRQLQAWALGSIELGDDQRLIRTYFEDEDYFLQVLLKGSVIEEVILFGYHSARPITDNAELTWLAGPESAIGRPTYVLDGETYLRQWGDAAPQAELVPLHETVNNPEARYRIRHLSLLYARDIGLPDRREFLLFSVEEDEQGALSLSTAVGITLQRPDIRVI